MNHTQLQDSFRAYFKEMGYEINWEGFALTLEIHVIHKGNYLFQQGEQANRLYFLHKGLMRYVSVSDTGKEFTQTFAKSPRIIGSTRSMVTQSPALFGIQALEDCIVISYPWPTFFEQLQHDNNFLAFYIRFLENIFISKEERESAFVKDSAECRYLNFCADYPELKERVPLQQIASYIGITPVALSRIRAKLSLN